MSSSSSVSPDMSIDSSASFMTYTFVKRPWGRGRGAMYFTPPRRHCNRLQHLVLHHHIKTLIPCHPSVTHLNRVDKAIHFVPASAYVNHINLAAFAIPRGAQGYHSRLGIGLLPHHVHNRAGGTFQIHTLRTF